MVFWGVEVKPGEPYWHREKIGQYEGSRLHLSQATLGMDAPNGKERTVVKCKVGGASELLLCSLTPGKSESCSLDLLFDQDVEFSVAGPSSVHLVGYFMPLEDEGDDDEDDDEEYSLDSESDSEFDDDLEVEGDSEDDEAPILVELANLEDDGNPSGPQIFQIENAPALSVPEAIKGGLDTSKKLTKAGAKERQRLKAAEDSEDEDGFPLPSKRRKAVNGSVPPVESEAGANEAKTEKAKKKKKKDKVKPSSQAGNEDSTPEKPLVEKSIEPAGNGAGVTSIKDKQRKKAKPAIRKFPNGLEIEEIAMGKPDARQTKRGKRVSVYYTGKLKPSGKVFDSNVGRKPFTFRLGVGEVIKGWDVGVEGMRVGDKRRIVVPPPMGYGAKGAGKDIPGNSWLEFTVELVDVAK